MRLKKIIILSGLFFLIALPVSAALPALVPKCALGTTVPPLSCFLELLGNVAKWILGISGSLALLMFVYGGFMFLISGGSSKRIEEGKTILTRAIIGLIIIFGAYVGVTFLMKAFGFKASSFTIPAEKTTTKCECICKEKATGEDMASKGKYSSASECGNACINGGNLFSSCK